MTYMEDISWYLPDGTFCRGKVENREIEKRVRQLLREDCTGIVVGDASDHKDGAGERGPTMWRYTAAFADGYEHDVGHVPYKDFNNGSDSIAYRFFRSDEYKALKEEHGEGVVHKWSMFPRCDIWSVVMGDENAEDAVRKAEEQGIDARSYLMQRLINRGLDKERGDAWVGVRGWEDMYCDVLSYLLWHRLAGSRFCLRDFERYNGTEAENGYLEELIHDRDLWMRRYYKVVEPDDDDYEDDDGEGDDE